MALTIAKIADAPDRVSGNRRERRRTITFDSSYPTGGESLVPSDVGLKRIEEFRTHGEFRAANNTTGINVSYDHTNQKLIAYWGNAGTASAEPEVSNTTDLSTYSGRVSIIGV
jgi:hypothetical protein